NKEISNIDNTISKQNTKDNLKLNLKPCSSKFMSNIIESSINEDLTNKTENVADSTSNNLNLDPSKIVDNISKVNAEIKKVNCNNCISEDSLEK
ncbi:hypothetical protein, partial [Klebsiella pneumoniae]|uniref:hypothetical protein n=1 Tax=Klebsiella pneumoniae TaxID=573 RepID=UPI00163DBC16